MADTSTTKAAAPSKRTTAATAPTEAPAAEPSAPDTSGWYRNDSLSVLIVMPDRYPSARLEPGQAEWLPADPQHPDLKPCDAPTVAAADTTRSEQ
jgi:hypothetical protein